MDIPQEDRLTYNLTAEANVLNRYMVDFAKQEFANVPGVNFSEADGFVLILEGFPYGIDGQCACRFKKLDGDGRSSNVRTGRALAVRRNDNTLLDGMPEKATWVDLGYVLNGLRTGIAEVQAIRVMDTSFIMDFPLEEGGLNRFPRPLGGDFPDSGNRFANGATNSNFIIFKRREKQGSDDSESTENE